MPEYTFFDSLKDMLPYMFIYSFGAFGVFLCIIKFISDESYFRKNNDARVNGFKKKISEKIDNKIVFSYKDVIRMGQASGLDSEESTNALYALYLDARVERSHELYRSLVAEIDKEEPFESLPSEVRPSLGRLAIMCADSDTLSDKHLLDPVTKILHEYQVLKKDHEAIKRTNKLSFVLTFVGFLVGVIGLTFAYLGPSERFITEEVNRLVEQISEQTE